MVQNRRQKSEGMCRTRLLHSVQVSANSDISVEAFAVGHFCGLVLTDGMSPCGSDP